MLKQKTSAYTEVFFMFKFWVIYNSATLAA